MTVNTQTNSAQSEAALPELEKVDNGVITVEGELYLPLIKAQAEISILLERFDELKAESMDDVDRFNAIKHHLFKMLDEHEGRWDRKTEENKKSPFPEQIFSPEFAGDYIPAAKSAKSLGRKSDRIKEVEEWLNSSDSLPFKVK